VRLWRALLGQQKTQEIARYSVSQYANDLALAYNGHRYLLSGGSAGYNKTEDIETSFSGYISGLYKSNGIVFAIILARMLLFCEARFAWFEINENGEDGKPKGRGGLDVLERPWPNGGTGELLARMEQDVSLGGNFYAIRDGDRLRRLRPDWVTIVLTAPPAESSESEVAGYWYHPGRSYSNAGEPAPGDDVYLPGEVCHWSPLPDPDAQYRGMSWLAPVVREVQADKSAMEHKLNFFTNGATFGAIVSAKESLTNTQYKEWKANFEGVHSGAGNAYKTLFLASPVDTSVTTANMQQLDFKVTVGAGETRLCAAGGVPPIIVGLSEGLASATYSNYGMARRKFGDHWAHPQWKSASQALAALVEAPDGDVRLGVNTKGIAFLREDAKDLAEIQQIKASTLSTLIMAGYTPDSAAAAVEAEDLSLLKHTGLTSVQLVPPGTTEGSIEDEAAGEEYDALLAEEDVFEEDGVERARYNIRNPEGSVGGGRFRRLSDVIVALLRDSDGDGDPLEDFTQAQLRTAARQLGLVEPRQRTTRRQLKLALAKHARRDRDRDAGVGGEPGERSRRPLSRAQRDRVAAVVDAALADMEAVPFADDSFGGRPSARGDLENMRDLLRGDGPISSEELGFVVDSLHHRFGTGNRTNAFSGRERHDIELVDHLSRWTPQIMAEATGGRSARRRPPRRADGVPGSDRVSGIYTDRPILPNNWGAVGGDVNFHEDGAIGQALRRMGDDRQIDIDGEPLANVVGRLATETVRGQRTMRQLVADLEALRERLPDLAPAEGSGGRRAREALGYALRDMTKANRVDDDLGELPEGTPEPLRRLMAALEANPLARRETYSPDRETEVEQLHEIARRFVAGDRDATGGRLIDAIRDLANQRHESREGKFELDRAVRTAVADLESMRRADRRSLDGPPRPSSRDTEAEALLSARSALDLRRIATVLGVQLPATATTKPAIIAAILDQIDVSLRRQGDHLGTRHDRLSLIREAVESTTRPEGAGDVDAAVDRVRAAVREGGGPAEVQGRILRELNADPGLTSARLRRVAEALNIDLPADMRHRGSMQMHIAEHARREPEAPSRPASPADGRRGSSGFSRERAETGDIVEWRPEGEEPVRGTVRRDGRNVFVDWDTGRTERITTTRERRGGYPDIHLVKGRMARDFAAIGRVIDRDSPAGIVQQLRDAATDRERRHIIGGLVPHRLLLVADRAGVPVGDDDTTEQVREAVLSAVSGDAPEVERPRSIAELRSIGEAEGIPLPRRATREQLEAHIRDFRFHRDNPTASQFRDPRAGEAQPTTDDHVASLEAMTTREEATAYLEGVRGQALTDLARRYSATHGRTVAERRRLIVEAAVGSRLDSFAINGGARLAYGDQPHVSSEPRRISNREVGELALRLRRAHDLDQDSAVIHARELLAERNPAGSTFELDEADDGLDDLDARDLVDLAIEHDVSTARDRTRAQLLTALRARNVSAPDTLRRRSAVPEQPTAPPVGTPPPDRIAGRRPSAGLQISLALQKWSNGDGPDEPLVGKFTRDQLRREAVARGITVRRGATDAQIADLLKAETREHFQARQRGRADLRSMADLMDPMQRTSDDDVRAVFEGNFGGMTTEVRDIYRSGPGERPYMGVEGRILDSSGREVGEFSRSYNRDNDGNLVAHHEFLSIRSQVQGSGFSNAFNGHLIRWYRESGAKQVRVHADIDVGGYAWARMGYDFANEHTASGILDRLNDEVRRLESTRRSASRGGDWREEIRQARELLLRAGDRRFGEPGYPTPYEISQLGRWDGAGRMDKWIGKRILLGSDWFGVLRL
jgi:phage portal protein BeeE